MTAPGSGHEASRARRRIAVAVVAATIAAILSGWLAWLLLPEHRVLEPVRETGAESASETSAPITSPAEPVTSPTAQPAPAEPPKEPAAINPSPFVRAPRIAFRLGGTLYVAEEDGSSPTPVSRVPEGPYALSPDGMTLATIAEGRLSLIDVASGGTIDAGAAIEERPVWTPDSKAVLFVRRSGSVDEVHRVAREDGTARRLRQGGAVSISPNGRFVVVTSRGAAAGAPDDLWVSKRGSAFSRLRIASGSVTALAAADASIYVAIQKVDGAGVQTWIDELTYRGRVRRRLADAPTEAVAVTFGEMCLSPDGWVLAAVVMGDDEYSRVILVDLLDGSQKRVSPRRDGYLRCWSSTGEYLYLIEGNAYQGEPTALYRVRRDGTGRRALVTGAE